MEQEDYNMNVKTKMLCVLLSVLFLTMQSGIVVSIPTGSFTTTDSMTPAADYDFASRRSPINLLVYNEYSDLSPTGEWKNTMNAILEVYGPAFDYENLTDYTQLNSMINDFDVFLIPEQETASISQSETIGSAWAGILADFVAAGGILISLDGGTSIPQTGAKILNATNLLKTYNEQIVTSSSINVVNAADALAFGVASSFTGPNAVIAVDVNDGDIIFEHGASHKAVVVHKAMGVGHIVLIGTDFNTPDVNVKELLANAIRLTRLAVFDDTHNQQGTPIDQLSILATELTVHGFAIATMGTWDDALVAHCNILVVPNSGFTPMPFSSHELDVAEEFVSGGGGLWIMSDYWDYGNTTDSLLQRFGYERNYSNHYFADTDDNTGNQYQPTFGSGNVANHSATIGAGTIQLFGATAFDTIPADAIPLIWSDSDGTAIWGTGPDEASGLALAAASHYGAGRVVAMSDGNWATDTYFSNLDNNEFAASIAIWLSAAGIPEKTILFEQSHSPYASVASLAEFARMLSFNGFNIQWEFTFSEALINQANIVVNIDGNSNYSAVEKSMLLSFVANGGGLFMLCDWSSFNVQTNDIISGFGMEVNGTSYLMDEDDGWVDSPTNGSYIAYDNGNIASHPIMNGVSRIEIDRGCGFSSIGSGTALVRTDNDGTSFWFSGEAANAIPVIAVTSYQFGRVVVVPDINFLSTGDPDGDSYPQLYDSSNDVFLANAFYWLIENRAPIVEVLFPNGGEVLNGTQTVSWTAVDPNPFDSLTFDVYYSDNNGSDWTPLALGLTLQQYEWNTTQHDDGTTYKIRVVASDGALQGQDSSDNPFELDNFAGPGFPLDPLLLVLIGGAVLAIVIVLVVLTKRKGGSKK